MKITTGNQKHKSKNQLDTIKNVKKILNQDKKLSISLMILKRLDLKRYMKQNIMED